MADALRAVVQTNFRHAQPLDAAYVKVVVTANMGDLLLGGHAAENLLDPALDISILASRRIVDRQHEDRHKDNCHASRSEHANFSLAKRPKTELPLTHTKQKQRYYTKMLQKRRVDLRRMRLKGDENRATVQVGFEFKNSHLSVAPEILLSDKSNRFHSTDHIRLDGMNLVMILSKFQKENLFTIKVGGFRHFTLYS